MMLYIKERLLNVFVREKSKTKNDKCKFIKPRKQNTFKKNKKQVFQ